MIDWDGVAGLSVAVSGGLPVLVCAGWDWGCCAGCGLSLYCVTIFVRVFVFGSVSFFAIAITL